MKMFDFDLHKIFVEGKTDQALIQFLLEEKFAIKLNEGQVNDFIINCGGWTNLEKKTSVLLDPLRLENKGKNIIIFDADGKNNEGGFEKRKKKLESVAKKLKIEFKIFLFPNNENDGDLESFYSSCFKKEMKFFKDCWGNLYNCIEENNIYKLDLNVPTSADMVFSYVDLFEKHKEEEYENKKSKRNYFDKGLWEFDFENNKNLKNLIEFLENNLINNE